MSTKGDITKLKSSWTKYDCVQIIEIIGANELESYLSGQKEINIPILKSYLGISDLADPIPDYWNKIQNFPTQRKLFTLAAGIFTHYDNIVLFAEDYANNNMTGVFKIGEGGKHLTNIRSALVVSGAANNSDRKKTVLSYDLSELFIEEEIGAFFKELLIERLLRVGYEEQNVQDNFYEISIGLNFHKALSLNTEQFKKWIEGKRILKIKEFQFDLKSLVPSKKITAIKVRQWLKNWDDIDFKLPLRRKPDPFFYIFNIDIRLLKHLSDVHRRKASKKRSDDTNVQRGHDEKRSSEISRYIDGGFPWSTLNEKDKKDVQYENLKMPGLLPTAIVANILGPLDKRGRATIDKNDLITIVDEGDSVASLYVPDTVFNSEWNPELKPFEIIDGQHRLLAFNETDVIDGNYEVPVVAYYNLDRAWQAYLFYVINIKPKRINTSLGYDLYPLLRTQEWLENSKDGLIVYRESRAQELVEVLWLYEESPWHNRISMLGISDTGSISQSAFIRALTNSYLKKNIRREVSGLFADVLTSKNYEELKWVRAQQAAFLILLWEQLALNASTSNNEWAVKLRKTEKQLKIFEEIEKGDYNIKIDESFLGKNSMLSKDQGVTGISMFSNDFFFVAANHFNDYDFNSIEWEYGFDDRQIENSSVDKAISQMRSQPIYSIITAFASETMSFDWRTPSADFDDPNQQELQKKYKGSGGYREVWKGLLNVFKNSTNEQIKNYALKLEELS